MDALVQQGQANSGHNLGVDARTLCDGISTEVPPGAGAEQSAPLCPAHSARQAPHAQSHIPPFSRTSVTASRLGRWWHMSRSRRLRDLAGAPAFEQLTAELARAAVVAKGHKALGRQADGEAQSPVSTKSDGNEQAAPPGPN